jgi:AP-1 complex subunit gamma-1
MALATSLLKEKHHGVLISAIQLCTGLCKASKDALDYLRKARAFFFFLPLRPF